MTQEKFCPYKDVTLMRNSDIINPQGHLSRLIRPMFIFFVMIFLKFTTKGKKKCREKNSSTVSNKAFFKKEKSFQI